MPSVQLGPRLFDTQFKLYRFWRSSFWRETIQNAVDGDGVSSCNRITIAITNMDGFARVVFEDNGPGMSKETLEKVFFVLGETGKANSTNTIGGFGMARILVCFAQKRYSIQSRDWKVEGVGGEWDYVESPGTYQGVKLEIDVDRDGWERLEDDLKAYLKTCQLTPTVTVNGQRWTEWTYRRRLARELSFASVHTNKSATPQLLVRVNGVTMFDCYTTAPALVTVEIDPSRSREILQMSRDGLTGEFQNELNSFINEINVDKQSALRKRRCKSTHFQGSGGFKSRKKNTRPNIFAELLNRTVIAAIDDDTAPAPVMPRILHNTNREVQEYRAYVDLFDVLLEDETEYNSKVRAKIDQYNPQRWDLSAEPVRSNVRGAYRKGTGMFRLLVLWKSACECCIDLLQNKMNGPDEVSWGVGWIFADDTDTPMARHVTKGETSYLLLNPCDNDGKMKFSLSDREDLIKIIASAAHEVCHIVHREHDQYFANALTTMAELVMVNLSTILGKMKIAKEMSLKEIKQGILI